MSSNLYNLDGIQTEIRKDIERKEAILAAWQAVTFPTKKDGTPFKIMSKNISGAALRSEDYAMQPGENKLKVFAWGKTTGYVESYIYAYCHVCDLKDEKKIEKTQNYMPKQAYLKQIYCFDLEDIKEAVSAKIENTKVELEQLRDQLEASETVYTEFRKAYSEALSKLAIDSKKAENSNLYYMIVDTVTKHPYC